MSITLYLLTDVPPQSNDSVFRADRAPAEPARFVPEVYVPLSALLNNIYIRNIYTSMTVLRLACSVYDGIYTLYTASLLVDETRDCLDSWWSGCYHAKLYILSVFAANQTCLAFRMPHNLLAQAKYMTILIVYSKIVIYFHIEPRYAAQKYTAAQQIYRAQDIYIPEDPWLK